MTFKTALLTVLVTALALFGAVAGKSGCGGTPDKPHVTTSDNVTGIIWTMPWSWTCLSKRIIEVEVRADGEVYLTSNLQITARGEAQLRIRLPCGVYTVSAMFKTVFRPEGVKSQFVVESCSSPPDVVPPTPPPSQCPQVCPETSGLGVGVGVGVG